MFGRSNPQNQNDVILDGFEIARRASDDYSVVRHRPAVHLKLTPHPGHATATTEIQSCQRITCL